jgi:hypothetical protein
LVTHCSIAGARTECEADAGTKPPRMPPAQGPGPPRQGLIGALSKSSPTRERSSRIPNVLQSICKDPKPHNMIRLVFHESRIQNVPHLHFQKQNPASVQGIVRRKDIPAFRRRWSSIPSRRRHCRRDFSFEKNGHLTGDFVFRPP